MNASLGNKFGVMHLVASLILIAALPVPYGYYQFIRYAAPAGIIFILINGWQGFDILNKAILLLIVLLFNPIEQFNLGRSLWIVADLISAGYLWFLGGKLMRVVSK